MKSKLLVILGPTATGKTDIALSVAKKFNGELIACDSRQVYKGLDVGTGKEAGEKFDVKKGDGFWEIDGVKIWMYDVVNPKVQYTAYDYAKDAREKISDITGRGKLPILVGGTGLYLQAIIEGLPNLNIPVDQQLRGELQKLSLDGLQNKLQSLSPTKWENLTDSDKKNPRRLLRSIELVMMNPYEDTSQKSKFNDREYNVLKIGLTTPRPVLNKRIDSRLISRLHQGMIEEAQALHKNGLTYKRMRELGLEYGMMADLLEGKINQEQFIDQLTVKIHQYAKRQMTWFKKELSINWFDITDQKLFSKVEKLVHSWYDAGKY